MYAIYGNIDPINIPQMLALIYQHHGSVMGYVIICHNHKLMAVSLVMLNGSEW